MGDGRVERERESEETDRVMVRQYKAGFKGTNRDEDGRVKRERNWSMRSAEFKGITREPIVIHTQVGRN